MKNTGSIWTTVLSAFLISGLAVSSVVMYLVLDRELGYKEIGMRRTIRSAAFAITDSLTYELYAAYSMFRLDRPLPEDATREYVVRRYSDSRRSFRESSRFPDLILTIAFLERYEDGGVRCLSGDDGREIDFPEWLAPEIATDGEPESKKSDRIPSGGSRRYRPSMENPVIAFPGIFVRENGIRTELIPVVRMDTDVIVRKIVPALTGQYLSSGDRDYEIAAFYKLRSMPSVGENADLVIPLIPQTTFETPMGYYDSRLRILHNAGIASDLPPSEADRPWYSQDELHPVLPEDEGWFMAVTLKQGGISAYIARERLKNAAIAGGLFVILAGSFLLILGTNMKARRLATREQEFVTLVSHELKTPLAVIRSVGENLEAGLAESAADSREYGRIIVEENRRLTSMVENILTISAVRNGVKNTRVSERVDWNDLIRSVVKNLAPFAREQGAVLKLVESDGIAPLSGDRSALAVAVRNLVTNAVRHGKPVIGDHAITVTTGTVRKFGRIHVALTVDDRGLGIPPEERTRIFRLFSRGRRAESEQIPGSGVGLSLAAGIAKTHGGSLAYEDNPAGGARFILSVPGRKR